MDEAGTSPLRFTIVIGDPIDGISLYGIFKSHEEATEYAGEYYHQDTWWVIVINPL